MTLTATPPAWKPMPKPTMIKQMISWKEVLTFLSPDGQQQLVDFIRKAKNERGKNWLPEIKAEFPTFSWIVELVCTRTAEEAYDDLQAEFSAYPLWVAKSKVLRLHTILRTEIERER